MTEKQVQELLETVKNLTAENKNLADENVRLKQKLERMNELLLNAQRARFGQSSEKRSYTLPGSEQTCIFNEAEQEQDQKAEEPTEKTLVATHERKKKRTNAELTKDLPVKEIFLDLPDDRLACSVCGNALVRIGKKFLREELQIIPKQVCLLGAHATEVAGGDAERSNDGNLQSRDWI